MPKRTEGKTGWASLFWTAFKRSQNAMALLDDRRRVVEVNGACLRAVGYRRDALVGMPVSDFVKGGRRATEAQWRAMLAGGDFFGEAELLRADGSTISVHYAAHPDAVTGRRLVLFVVLDIARRGRFTHRSHVSSGEREPLSEREREVVHHVALGRTGPEIADELHISHETVRTHVRNAQRKLGARSRAQLVAIALGEGRVPGLPGKR